MNVAVMLGSPWKYRYFLVEMLPPIPSFPSRKPPEGEEIFSLDNFYEKKRERERERERVSLENGF